MNHLLIHAAVLAGLVTIVNGANILALLNIPSVSMHYWNKHLLLALAKRGYNVTVLSTRALMEPVPNHTDIVLEGIYDVIEKHAEEMSDVTPWETLPMLMDWSISCCSFSLQNKGMKILLSYPEDFKFDLIIFEPTSGECLLGVVKRFGSPPIIAVSTFSHVQWINYNVANPDNPAYIPHLFLPYSDHLTFYQRLNNALLYLYASYLWHTKTLPAMDENVKQYLGSAGSHPSEELRKISLMLVNTQPSVDYPRPLLPSVINIAGIHIKEPKALPKDLQDTLDEAKEGVIYFSLGTNIRSDKLNDKKKKELFKAFAELPYKVLCKWDSDILHGQPKNVAVRKWLSQTDILAHPNVRLFITHGGLLSTQEAIHRGVPVIGIPFYLDQKNNIQKAITHGIGVKLAYEDITKETVLNAVHTVLDNPSYSKNMKRLSALFRDQPESPLERAVFWCEYVIKERITYVLQPWSSPGTNIYFWM